MNNGTLEGAVVAYMEDKRRLYPCRSNRASELGHPCLRYLVFNRTRGTERKIHDVGMQFIFDHGNTMEEMALKRLQESGFVLSHQQADFEIPEFDITGHIDANISDPSGKILPEGTKYPVEIKGINQFDWEAISCMDDMTNSKKSWLRKYPTQFMCYLFGTSFQHVRMNDPTIKALDFLAAIEASKVQPKYGEGCFYLVNKQSSQGKDIWGTLDPAFVRDLLLRADAINRHIKESTVPERIAYEPQTCDKCCFADICLPPRESRGNLLIEQSPQIEAKLDRRAELEEDAKTYSKLDEEVKTWAKMIPQTNINVGSWMITKKTTARGVSCAFDKIGEAKVEA